jgi:hypothetical protein
MNEFFKKIIRNTRNLLRALANLEIMFDEVKLNQGKILARLNENLESDSLQDYEFKVFSQWGDDGIIQHMIRSIEIKNKTFIEFGVEDFFESNSRFLMVNNNWSGFVIDGSQSNIDRLRGSYFYWMYELKSECEFITRDNIEELLEKSGFDYDLGLLHIDLDGNDYFVLEAINKYSPRILICEFNAVFGPERKITVPYIADFQRTKHHSSNLYFGCSLAAINQLAERKEYSLVGVNSASNNAYFIRNDLMTEKIRKVSVLEAYRPSMFRESRDDKGNLTFVSGDKRLEVIKGMPVFDIDLDEMVDI